MDIGHVKRHARDCKIFEKETIPLMAVPEAISSSLLDVQEHLDVSIVPEAPFAGTMQRDSPLVILATNEGRMTASY